MARDVEADVKVNDKTAPGLTSVEKRFRESGKRIEKDYDKFGSSAGNAILKGVGAVSPKLAAKLAQGIGDSASLGAPLLISGIAAALPVLSGLIGSAVTGGAAGAGIIGGVALAARDARVKEAGSTLASNLLANLTQQAGPFIAPVLGVIDQVGERFSENGDKIERIFANSSKFVEPLADALLDVGDNLIDGLDTAISRAGPVMESLNGGLRKTGDAIEGLIDNVTSNATGNAVILDATFSGLAGTINLVGTALGAVTYVFEQLNSVMPLSLLGQLNDLFSDTDENAAAAAAAEKAAAAETVRLAAAAEIAEKDTQLYNKALEDNARAAEVAQQAQQSLFSDTTRVGEAQDKAAEAARKNGQTLSANTEKGRANRSALSDLAGALNTYRANQVKAGASTQTTSRTLESQRASFYKVALQMTGNRKKAQELTNTLLGIPPRRNTSTQVNTAQAQAAARNLRQEIAQIPRSVSTTVSVNTAVAQSRLAAVERRLARINGGNYAAGDSFGATTGGQGARTGGPVEVLSSISVSLDGVPFRTYTVRSIDANNRRNAFRDKVGKRVSQ